MAAERPVSCDSEIVATGSGSGAAAGLEPHKPDSECQRMLAVDGSRRREAAMRRTIGRQVTRPDGARAGAGGNAPAGRVEEQGSSEGPTWKRAGPEPGGRQFLARARAGARVRKRGGGSPESLRRRVPAASGGSESRSGPGHGGCLGAMAAEVQPPRPRWQPRP